MKRYEKIVLFCFSLAAIGVILFWVFGARENTTASAWSIVLAGVAGGIGLVTMLLGHLRNRHLR
ncbi:MAG: hypothetical protein J6T72_00530 [Alphaproteobacteria bacterium]|nr:hypothetical protein [Alphaproteobacteria bacterium]